MQTNLNSPLARIVSHYRHCLDLGIYTQPLDEVLSVDETFLNRSRYHYQLSRYLELFPEPQFKILFLEELEASPAKQLDGVFRFLGVSSGAAALRTGKRYNRSVSAVGIRGGDAPFGREAYRRIIGPIREDAAALEAYLGRSLTFWDLSEARWVRSS